MDEIFKWVFIGGGALVVLFILMVSVLSKIGANMQRKFYEVYTPEGLQIVKKLEELIETNGTLPYLGYHRLYDELFGKLDTQGDPQAYEKAIGIHGYDAEPEGSLKFIAGEYFDNLQWDLEHRHRTQHRPLYSYNEAEAMKKYGLNIHADEFVHENINKVDWLEEKTITTSVTYGGYRYRMGDGINYSFGSLNFIQNKRDYFAHVDRGSLYITNKRILFVGSEKHQNRSLDLDAVLEFTLFRDGILIGKANGRKPLIEFGEYVAQPNKAPRKRDHVNRVARVLNRVLHKTQFENV